MHNKPLYLEGLSTQYVNKVLNLVSKVVYTTPVHRINCIVEDEIECFSTEQGAASGLSKTISTFDYNATYMLWSEPYKLYYLYPVIYRHSRLLQCSVALLLCTH